MEFGKPDGHHLQYLGKVVRLYYIVKEKLLKVFLSQGDMIFHSFNEHLMEACFLPVIVPGTGDKEKKNTLSCP